MTKKGPSIFFETGVANYFMKERVDTMIVTGCNTSGCIRGSALDSFSHRFRTLVPEDCVGDIEEQPHRTICATSAGAMSMSPIWRSASTIWNAGASATAPELADVLADVHPFGVDEFGQAQGIDAKRTARRAGGGNHFVEGF